MLQGLTQCLIVAPKYYFLARLTDVPRRITPQMDVPLDQNSLALRARCGVVDDSVWNELKEVRKFFPHMVHSSRFGERLSNEPA